MSLSLSEIALPTFAGALSGMKAHLAKGADFAKERAMDPADLVNARLAPDMFTLAQQVQAATDTVRRGLARLENREPASMPDIEPSFDALIERVDATLGHVEHADRAAIDASETREFTVNLGQDFTFTGRTYLMTFMVPNVLFHAVTLYDILRHSGVQLGKPDYIAPFMRAS